jgi:hypothetical protein
MAAGHGLIPELMSDLIGPPMLTGLWLLFVSANNRIVDQKGRGCKIEARSWRLLIHLYFVVFILTLIHF